LSAGQRRRVALAVLLARQPALWLLDEPHAGLDAAGRDLVDEMVLEGAAGGATVMLASHEADRARPLAARMVSMVGGRVDAALSVSPRPLFPLAGAGAATPPAAQPPATPPPAQPPANREPAHVA
ncbi:MAG: ABC transporter ATP-binding protein, partial [Acidimicrobiales bacterium]